MAATPCSAPAAMPWQFKLLRNLFSFFAILLWIAALLCFVPGVDLPQLGIAILTVVLVNGLFAFLQEYKSDRALEMLQQLIAQRSTVIRDGNTQEIAAAALVPGDVIVLEEGDLVPADCRLTEAFEVEVDNSSLTGESSPARRYKSDQPVLIAGKFLWIELPNILFAGTSLLRGRARAVIFGTAMSSEIGKIANLTQEIERTESAAETTAGNRLRDYGAGGWLGLGFSVSWLVGGRSDFPRSFGILHRPVRRQRSRRIAAHRHPFPRHGRAAHGQASRAGEKACRRWKPSVAPR